MPSHWLLERIAEFGKKPALIRSAQRHSYEDLHNLALQWGERLEKAGIRAGSVTEVCGDYSADSIAVLLALLARSTVCVPVAEMPPGEREKRREVSACDFSVNPESGDILALEKREKNRLVKLLAESGKAGLILFSSGTTGEPKGMARDLGSLIDSHKGKKPMDAVLLMFLLFDHIGGLNTLFGALARGNQLVIPVSRSPESVGALVQDCRVRVLPTSPSFLALMVAAGVFEQFNFDSLRLVTYGTEPMPRKLLEQLKARLPRAKFLQTFGTSETGIIQTVSRSSGSLDIKFTDSEQEHKIVDGELWLRSPQAVLGYLNAPQDCFTEDGWFKTGDLVEEKGDGWMKIAGRKRDVINVGGQKVLPTEVESFLLGCPEVADCMAYGIPSHLTGQSVAVDIVPARQAPSPDDLKRILRRACLNSLEKFKAPTKFNFVEQLGGGARFKKKRNLP